MTPVTRMDPVKDFADLLQRFASDDPRTIYRGLPNKDYKLLTKFDRLCNESCARKEVCTRSIEQVLICERDLLKRFRLRGTQYLRNLPRNDWEWLSLGQHHGLPTRLMDWTDNPLVAAYFAVRHQIEMDGVVYSLIGKGSFVDIIQEPDPFTHDISRGTRLFPMHVTTRIVAQAGLFTLGAPGEGAIISKLEIPGDLKPDICKQLNEYGINEFALFPDLDAACHFVHWQHETYDDPL